MISLTAPPPAAAAAARFTARVSPSSLSSVPRIPHHLSFSLLSRPREPLTHGFVLGFHRQRQRRRLSMADELEPSVPPLDLEPEIYDFMQRSAKPTDFPTKAELIAAGRADLAAAIESQGGWLAFGWDSEGEGRCDLQIGDEIHQEDEMVSQHRVSASGGSDSSCTPSFSGRSMEVEGGGIEGILSRLERERDWSYVARSAGEKVDRYLQTIDGDNSGKEVNGTRNSTPDMWRTWSLNRAGFQTNAFEAAEIVPDEKSEQLNEDLLPDVSVYDDIHEKAHTVRKTGKKRKIFSDQNKVHLQLQHLESELKTALNLLTSKVNIVTSNDGEESSLKELHRLSDALEFQETGIMKARDKLRSTRAKLTVLEGKITLEIIEAQKVMEDKQRRVEAAQKAFHLLRTACIVWPTSASEVLLVGSFDGWTSKRRMERSSSGIFSLYLKLYPGRYEIKFVVDGIWMVDPLRPIAHNNGHKNNILIVS